MDTTASRHDIRDWWRGFKEMVERRQIQRKTDWVPIVGTAVITLAISMAGSWIANRGTDATSVAVMHNELTDINKKLDSITTWQNQADQRYVMQTYFLQFKEQYDRDQQSVLDRSKKAQDWRDDQSDKTDRMLELLQKKNIR